MIRRLATVLGLLGAALPAGAPAEARVACSDWYAFATDEPGETLRRLEITVLLSPRRQDGVAVVDGRPIRGQFDIGRTDRDWIAVWSPQDNDLGDAAFTTEVGTDIAFLPDNGGPTVRVRYGWLARPVINNYFLVPDRDRILCTASDEAADDGRVMIAAEGSRELSDDDRVVILEGPRRNTPLSELFPPSDGEAPETPSAGSLGEALADVAPGSDVTAGEQRRLEELAGASTAEQTGVPDEAEAAEAPTVPAAAAEMSVCRSDDREPIEMLRDAAAPAASYTVGLRNGLTEAAAFNLERVSEEVFDLDLKLDVADSAGKLVAYEALRASREETVDGEAVDIFPVTFAGVGADRAVAAAASPQSSEPGSRLRILLVGEPKAIAISGLDKVEAELTKQSKGAVGLSIEWRDIDATGKLGEARTFDSVAALLASFAGRDLDAEPFLTPDEPVFAAFLKSFAEAITSRADPVDRVIWVKGAYAVPGSTPTLLQTFIQDVSESDAVPHRADGTAQNWLVVVTARMPGFSVAYLKEPIYSSQIGEVIDEPADNPTSPRRLIVDPTFLAAKLAGAAMANGGAATTGALPAEKVTGTLVLNGNEVFAERGYVLSESATDALVERLARLRALWKEDGSFDVAALGAWAKELERPHVSIGDIVQSADDLAGLRLPKMLPAWVRKDLQLLSTEERTNALVLATAFEEGAKALLRSAEPKAAEGECSHLYVSEHAFGFDRAW